MRGQVLGVDRNSGEGQIAGDDGQRYTFVREDWSDQHGPAAGTTVDFAAEGSRALRIFRVPAAREPTLAALQRDGAMPKSKIAAALLALFLGMFGVHKFYLGKTSAGIIMLLCGTIGWLLVLPGLFVWLASLIEFVIYLTKSDAEFERDYVYGDRSWF